MGFKSLSLQGDPMVLPRGESGDNDNLPHNPRLPTSSLTCLVRVVRIYSRPMGAAEVMKENPRHFVCHSDSFFIGQRVHALAVGDQLQPGHSYFLFPSHFFHSVLSFVTLTASFANSIKKPPLLRLFDIQKTPAGTLQI